MNVRDVYKKFSKSVCKVEPDTPIEKVVNVFLESKRRNIYVVNKSGNLMGLITSNEILTAVRPDISPNKVLFFISRKDIKKAKDIMIEPQIVKLDDSLEDALRVAKVFKIQDIPVCEEGKLVGELDAFELVHGLVKSEK